MFAADPAPTTALGGTTIAAREGGSSGRAADLPYQSKSLASTTIPHGVHENPPRVWHTSQKIKSTETN